MEFSKKSLMMLVVLMGVFMVVLDGTVINVAMPTISSYFNVDMDVTQWVVTAYMAAEVLLLILFGRAAGTVGKARMFRLGFAVFVLSSLACGLSTSLPMLVACRAFQGIGASMAFAVSYALMYEIFPPNERAKSMGYIGSIVAVAGLIGPAIGGYVVEWAGWQYVFFINIPVGIVMLVASWKYLNPTETKEDYTGKPLIDLSIFKNKAFTLSNIAMMLFFIAQFTVTILLPYYLELVMKLTPSQVGTFFMIVPCVTFLGAPYSGHLYDKYGWKHQSTLGAVLLSTGLVTMAVATRGWSYPLMCVAYAIIGIGSALFQSPNSTDIMNAIPRETMSATSALNSTFRNLGMVLGMTLGSHILVYQMSFAGIVGTVLTLDPSILAVFVSNGLVYAFGLALFSIVACAVRRWVK
jgi:MFS family permease